MFKGPVRLVLYFCEGLTFQSKQAIEIMCNSEFREKNPEVALDYLDYIADDA